MLCLANNLESLITIKIYNHRFQAQIGIKEGKKTKQNAIISLQTFQICNFT